MAEKQENMEFQEKLRRHRNRVRNRIIITAAAVLIALFAYILYQNQVLFGSFPGYDSQFSDG